MRAPPFSVCSGRLSAANSSRRGALRLMPWNEDCDASSSSVASSLKIEAISGIVVASGRLGRAARPRCPAGRCGSAPATAPDACAWAAAMRWSSSASACAMRSRSAAVRQEEAGVLVEVAADVLHRGHAVAEQRRSSADEADAGVEGLAQPVIQRLGEPDAMARLGHLRAAGKRVAGAIDRLRQHAAARAGPRRARSSRAPSRHGWRSRARRCRAA